MSRHRQLLRQAVVVFALLAVAGCESVHQDTGISKRTQWGALGGAAAGAVVSGTVIGATGASPAWLAAGVLGGALLGGAAAHLTEEEKEAQARSGYQALLARPPGAQRSWQNPATGNRGVTTVTAEFRQPDGRWCKRFTDRVVLAGVSHIAEGVGCRREDGSWQVVSIAPRRDGAVPAGR